MLRYTAPKPRRSAMSAFDSSSDRAPSPRDAERASGKTSARRDDRELLAGFEHDCDAAWRAFLDRYGSAMLRWLQRREDDVDAARDRWLEVCERLVADRCARLRQVRLEDDQPCLWPWLLKVMNHGVINGLWARIGRAGAPAKVRALGAPAVHLYDAMVQHGAGAMVCIESAALRHAEVPASTWLLAWEELQGVLDSGDRRWIASYYLRRHAAQDIATLLDTLAADDNPLDWAERGQTARELARALATLSPRQRLAVQLRFEQEMPHVAIGQVLGTGSSGARHVLREALALLAQQLHAEPLP